MEVVAGLPTLGLTLAAAVAQKLGHTRYVPLGTSRKFWYRDDLSVALISITTPTQQKRLYIDPRMLPLLEGRRVALIDDVISSGTSIVSGLQLLAGCGIEPVAIGAAMLQSRRWCETLDAVGPQWRERTVGVFYPDVGDDRDRHLAPPRSLNARSRGARIATFRSIQCEPNRYSLLMD